MGAQRVCDPEPAEQRERAAGGQQQRGEARPAVGAHEQPGEPCGAGQRERGRDHEPSPGVMPARLVTSVTPGISATPPASGGATTTL